jgi:serine/threonine-protein kinase
VDTEPATSYGGLEIRPNEKIGVRPGYADRAAVQLTWEAARLYCASRGKRLPTEAEWEFAARNGGSRRFPWGDEEPRCDGVVVARDDGRDCATLPRGPQPVGAGEQDWTPEGVHGLGGNVSEWVEDAFLSPNYPDCGACMDPVERGDSSHPAEFRVFRGGAWANSILTHASARGRWEAASVSASLGVRCAFSADR